MSFLNFRSWRPYFAGSVAAHLLLAATALLFRSDLDAHAPKVMYADLLATASPPPSAAGAPKPARTPPAVPPPPAPPAPGAAAAPSALAAPAPPPAETGPAGKAGDTSAPTAVASGSELNLYVSRVIDLLNRARNYPRDALAREEEGVVMLAVSVAADGSLTEEKVEAPSPYPSLNRAALETIKKVGQFPAPPKAGLTLHVPIRFKIKGR